MERSTIEELLKNQLISPKVVLEAFLATRLKLRPASQVTIPAELPHGVDMGKTIDKNIQPQMMKLQSIKDLRTRAVAVQAIKKLLEKQFEEIVEESDDFKALYDWSDKLGLRNNQVQVRPTVHEIYFYTERGTGRNIQKLMRQREKIRRKVQRKPGDKINTARFAYPEEFDPKWLKELGGVLGYPECCVNQYAEDRKNDVNVEVRASQQLVEEVKEKEVDTHVYYTGFFFPCSPRCENALKRGYEWDETLKELHPDLGALYEQNIRVNAELVLRQPELIHKFLSQFKPKED